MKKLFLIVALLVSVNCIGQTHWDVDTLFSQKTSDVMFQKASINLVVGLSFLLAGSGMAIYGANPGDSSPIPVMMYAGGGVAVCGIILQFMGYSQLGKAGQLLRQEKARGFALSTNQNGLSLAYRF
jgi:uncharacterized membrane protein YdcZ (DUF606 family)